MKRVFCKDANCRQWHKHDPVAKSMAAGKGWYHHPGGDAWCPEHIPRSERLRRLNER